MKIDIDLKALKKTIIRFALGSIYLLSFVLWFGKACSHSMNQKSTPLMDIGSIVFYVVLVVGIFITIYKISKEKEE